MAQDDRIFEITSPFGPDAVLLQRCEGREALSEPFEFNLTLLSTNGNLSYDKILGLPLTLTVGKSDGDNRNFHGIVTAFAYVGMSDNMFLYTATLRPWLWLLSKDQDCLIYQNMSIPDIVVQAFRNAGFSDFQNSLNGTYPSLDYCVQYRESTFNFVSRLMEQAGIYYFFTHDKSKHTLVLADSISAHPDIGTVPYRVAGTAGAEDEGLIDEWCVGYSIQSGQVTLNAFDFERPRANLEVRARGQSSYSHGSAEVYDYPGPYTQTDDGQNYARAWLEAYQAQIESVTGHGNAILLGVGDVFTLNGHVRSGQDQGHLLTGASYVMENSRITTGAGVQPPRYEYRFSAIEKKTSFRAPPRTPKPVVQGPQTAVVVGKSGEEIWTDQYGRINVQFHWDRKGQNNEKSSCWVRIAQPWAGSQFGAIMLPRIGQEVVVDFLEGDPDRPLVTGRVYNASNMPPYTLPDNATQSGIKTNSSKGGGGANEIRFEDKKGSEELYVNAQKDMNVVVLNNQTETISADQTVKITQNRTTQIGQDRTEKISNNDSLEIGAARTLKVGSDNSTTISGKNTVSIGSDNAVTISGKSGTTVSGDNKLEVDGDNKVEVDGDDSLTIDGDNTAKVGGDQSITVSGDRTLTISGASTHKASGNITVNSGGSLTIQASNQISLSCGSSSITLSSSGSISISGTNVTLSGSSGISAKSDGQMQVQGMQTTVKGTMLTLQADGVASLSGSLTKIG